jgi:hypothetical protein
VEYNGVKAKVDEQKKVVRLSGIESFKGVPIKIKISPNATIIPDPETVKDFSKPVEFKVTSAAGETATYVFIYAPKGDLGLHDIRVYIPSFFENTWVSRAEYYKDYYKELLDLKNTDYFFPVLTKWNMTKVKTTFSLAEGSEANIESGELIDFSKDVQIKVKNIYGQEAIHIIRAIKSPFITSNQGDYERIRTVINTDYGERRIYMNYFADCTVASAHLVDISTGDTIDLKLFEPFLYPDKDFYQQTGVLQEEPKDHTFYRMKVKLKNGKELFTGNTFISRVLN